MMSHARSVARPEVKWVYTFGAGRADGGAKLSALLGGKGAYLAEMSRLGMPVPPGFTISTRVSYQRRRQWMHSQVSWIPTQ